MPDLWLSCVQKFQGLVMKRHLNYAVKISFSKTEAQSSVVDPGYVCFPRHFYNTVFVNTIPVIGTCIT